MRGKSVLTSPRFVAAAVSLVIMIVVAFVPQLQPVERGLVEVLVQVIQLLLSPLGGL